MRNKGRGEKAIYNVTASILSQVVAMISGFVLPHLIIRNFGSAYNGITSSVSQFLSVIALLRGGVGGATRVALYKALANKDIDQVSSTIKATELFMRRIALVFVGFIVVLSCLYPLFVKDEFSWLFSASLVLIISISTFAQYFFGITYQFLLQADQRQYITTFVDILLILLNVGISVVLIKAGAGIHGVKLGSAVVFSILPFFLFFYCNKHYRIKRNVKPDFSSIGQRWDAFFHQLAAFIHGNTDITLLTVFYSQKVISVYTTYYLVGNGIRKILLTISSGIEAAFGDIIAKKEYNVLQEDLRIYETIIHVLSCALFSPALILITPFVRVYTIGVVDINYLRYEFGYLVVVSELLYCLRSPYEAILNAAGHFKQTKKYAFVEAGLNLVVSLCLVINFELIGVVIGTIVAIIFRIVAYGFYVDIKIVHRSVWTGMMRYLVSGLTIFIICLICRFVAMPEMSSYRNWILYAIPITLISMIVTVVINSLLYKHEMIITWQKLTSITKQVLKRSPR